MSEAKPECVEVGSLDEILSGFDPADPTGGAVTPQKGEMLGVWLPREVKAEYDRLQALSKRRFSRFVRAIVREAITKAAAKVG